MKKKFLTLLMTVVVFTVMLTGCIQNDIGVKLNDDGTGSISATIGIKKDFYDNLKEIGSDPFEDKNTTEYTYEDSKYIAYTEVKEYESFDDIEKALLDMTYDTELIENAQNAENGNVPVDTAPTVPAKDNHVFSSVSIDNNSGIFYSSYNFSAVMNPQSNEGLDYDMNDAFKVTLSVEMPEEITQYKGGTVEGNKITFDIADITERQEFAATCESNNTWVVIGIVVVLLLIVSGFIFIVKRKK